MLEAVQVSWAGVDRSAADALLWEALEAGLPWDAVTQAAARGSAERFARHAAGLVAARPAGVAPIPLDPSTLEPSTTPLPS